MQLIFVWWHLYIQMSAIIAPAFSRLILITQFNNNISIGNEICYLRIIWE